MNTKFPKKNRNSAECGFTLVELIVAAVVLLVAVGAIVAVVRMGVSMQISDQHRRQARTIVTSVFESAFPRYDGLRIYTVNVEGGCGIVVAPPIDDLGEEALPDENLRVIDGCVNSGDQETVAVITDVPIAFDDDGEPALRGTLTVTMHPSEHFQNTNLPESDVIRVHVVEVVLTWQEKNGADDEVRFTKRLASGL